MTSRPYEATGETPWLNPRILVLFSVVFLCGLALGAAGTRILLHRSMAPPAVRAAIGLGDLQKQLHLTPQQVTVVERELDDYGKYYQNLEEDRRDVAEHGKRRILAVLTPEQRKLFLAMLKRPEFPLH